MQEEIKQAPKFFRSQKDRLLGGVCGGAAEYFKLDSNLIRLLFVIFTIFWGAGIIIYLAALIIVPENPDEPAEPRSQSPNSALFLGILFVALGAVLLFWQMDLFDFFYFDIPLTTIWAIFLIAIGASMLFAQWKKQTDREQEQTEGDTEINSSEDSNDFRRNIFRSRTDRKIAGICGGLGKYLNIDPSLIRLAWILLTLASKGLGLLLYLIFIFVFPEEPSEQTA